MKDTQAPYKITSPYEFDWENYQVVDESGPVAEPSRSLDRIRIRAFDRVRRDERTRLESNQENGPLQEFARDTPGLLSYNLHSEEHGKFPHLRMHIPFQTDEGTYSTELWGIDFHSEKARTAGDLNLDGAWAIDYDIPGETLTEIKELHVDLMKSVLRL